MSSLSPRMRASAVLVAAAAGVTSLAGLASTAHASTPVAAVHQAVRAVKAAPVKAAPVRSVPVKAAPAKVTTAAADAQAHAAAHLAYLNKEAALDAKQAYYAAVGGSSASTPAASAPAAPAASAQQNSDAASDAQNAYNAATANSGSSSASSSDSSQSSDQSSSSSSDSADSSDTSDTSTTTTATDSSDPQAIAASIVPADQLASFDEIISHESGWDVTATNPSSGAYGLPQALPGDKMAVDGADWATDATTQIEWALQYMDATYGSPNQAWVFWQANNWY
jgi:hypothetical protein